MFVIVRICYSFLVLCCLLPFFLYLFFVCELSKAVKDCVGVYLSIIIIKCLEAFCNKLFSGHF